MFVALHHTDLAGATASIRRARRAPALCAHVVFRNPLGPASPSSALPPGLCLPGVAGLHVVRDLRLLRCVCEAVGNMVEQPAAKLPLLPYSIASPSRHQGHSLGKSCRRCPKAASAPRPPVPQCRRCPRAVSAPRPPVSQGRQCPKAVSAPRPLAPQGRRGAQSTRVNISTLGCSPRCQQPLRSIRATYRRPVGVTFGSYGSFIGSWT